MLINTYSATHSVLPMLRLGGVRVRIRHKRYLARHHGETLILADYARRWCGSVDNLDGYVPYPLGGETSVELAFPDGGTYEGVAKCSLKDRFDRKVGLAMALSRALAARREHIRLGVQPEPSFSVIASFGT